MADRQCEHKDCNGEYYSPYYECPVCRREEDKLVDPTLCFCPECGGFKPDDDRVKSGMKCAQCAY